MYKKLLLLFIIIICFSSLVFSTIPYLSDYLNIGDQGSTTTQDTDYGFVISTKFPNIDNITVRRMSGDTANVCRLFNSTTLVASSSYSGEYCNIKYTFVNQTNYYFVNHKDGSYSQKYGGSFSARTSVNGSIYIGARAYCTNNGDACYSDTANFAAIAEFFIYLSEPISLNVVNIINVTSYYDDGETLNYTFTDSNNLTAYVSSEEVDVINYTWYINNLVVLNGTNENVLDGPFNAFDNITIQVYGYNITTNISDNVSFTLLPVLDNPLVINNGFINQSVINGQRYDLGYNVTYYSAINVSINVTCDINDTIYYFSNDSITDSIVNYYNTSIDLNDYPLQECIINFLTTDNHNGENIVNTSYTFYIGGQINVSGFNQFDSTNFYNFTVNVTSINSSAYISNSYYIRNSTSFIDNVSKGTYNLLFYSNHYFDNNYNILFENVSQSYLHSSSQSQLNVYVSSLMLNTNITYYNVTLNNTPTFFKNQSSNGNTIISFYLNASYYNINVTATDYLLKQLSQTLTYKQNITINVGLGFVANFTIFDEYSGLPFNMSHTNSSVLYVFCPEQTMKQNFSTNTFLYTINCAYTKFRIEMSFEATGDEPIYRTYIIPPTSLNVVRAYFADGSYTPLVYIVFKADDTLGQYLNRGLYLNKYINTTYTTITADYFDAENKIGAYLIKNGDYNLNLYNNDIFERSMGFYTADTSKTIVLKLFSINTGPTVSPIEEVFYSLRYDNSTSHNYATAYYTDKNSLTTSVIFRVYGDSINSTPIYTETAVDPNNAQFQYDLTHNMTTYNNFYATLTFIHSGTTYRQQTTILEQKFITFPLLEVFSTKQITLAIFLILCVLSLYATVSSGYIMSTIIVVIAAFTAAINIFSINGVILGLLIIVNIISILRKLSKESV